MSGSADAGRLLVRIEATTAQLRQQLQQAEQQVAGTSAKIDGQLKQADKAFDRLNGASKAARDAVSGLHTSLGPLGSAFGNLGTAGIAAGAGIAALGAGLAAIAKAGDAATATLARLTSATGSAAQAEAVYTRLFALSQQTGVAVAESAGAFARFQVAGAEIGATTDQVLKLVAGLQKASIVAGSSGQEASAAMQQLAQALASGKLQGDELRSLLENMPQLAQALARELGVGIGQLREMGTEGKLTAETVFPALLKATERMNAEFDKMPPTMGRAFSILGESMAQFAADLDKALGLSQAIARAAKAAADAVNNVRQAAFPSERDQIVSDRTRAASRASELRTQLVGAGDIRQLGIGQLAGGDDRTINTARLREQLAAAEAEVIRHNDRLAEIDKEGLAQRFGDYVTAQRKAEETRRQGADKAYKDEREKWDREFKLRDDHRKRMEVVDKAESSGAISSMEATRDRARLNEELREGLEKLADTHTKVGKAAADADEHVQAFYKHQEQAAKEAVRAQEKAADEARRTMDRYHDEVRSQAQRISDDVATSIYEGLVEGRRGQTIVDWFGNLFKRIAIQAASTQIFLPITTGIVGAIPQLFGISQPGQAAGGGLGGIGEWLLGGIAPGPVAPGMAAPTFSGLLGSGGNLLGIPGLTGLLQGAGIGAGIGGLAAGLLGGNSTYGSIGGGLGAVLGQALIPIPGIGALIGGLLGGAGGGLLGPKQPNHGFGFAVRANGGNDGWATGTGLQITDPSYDEQGRAVFEQGTQLVASLNEFLAANKLTVYGARAIGGSRHGMGGLGYGEAASFQELLASFTFGSSANAGLNTYLGTQRFDDPAKLAAAVQGFTAAEAAIEALAAEAIPAFTAQLQAVNDNFDAATEQARKYGLTETELTAARAKAIVALEAQRTETLRQSDAALSIRRLAAGGNTQAAELARQAEAARLETEAFGRALDALAISAADRAARLVDLEEVQAAERAAIIQRYGEQAAQALIQAGGSIRAYLDSLATGTAAGASPTARLSAAQAAFDRDRTLAMGGDRDALGRITQSADALLGAGRDVYASGGGFQDILAGVRSGLGSLPVVQSYDAMQAASLTAIEQAILNGTLNTQTVILPGGNVVQLAGGLDLSAVVSALGATNATLGNVVATLLGGFHGLAQNTANTVDTLAGGFAGVWQNTANTVTTLVAGFGDLNRSVGAVDASARDLNASLATIHASIVQGNGVVATNIATHAANDNAGFAALGAIGNLANSIGAANAAQLGVAADHLAGIRRSATAVYEGVGVLAQGLAAVNGSVVAGNAAVATNIASHAANDAIGFAALGTVLNLANTIAAQAVARAIDVNASLGTVHAGVVDVNTSLSTVHAAQNAGNTIAASAAKMATETANAQNTILAASNANLVAALNAGNTIEAAGVASVVSALNAGNTLLGAANTTLSYTNSYASFIDNTLKAANNYHIEQTAELRGLRQQVNELKAAVADLRTTMQQVGVVVAQEARAGAQLVAGELDEANGTLRRLEQAA